MTSHPAPYTLPLPHILLALLVAIIWGTNFVVVKIVLDSWPPLFFVFVRFSICFLPLAFFLKRPPVPWTNLAAYGILIGCGQFGLGFIAMDGYLSPGLASVVLQTQAFFTIFLAMYFDGERLRAFQWSALSLAAIGVGLMAFFTWGNEGGNIGATGIASDLGVSQTTALGISLALFAAFFWGVANMTARRTGRINMLAYVVWASGFSLPPLLAMTLFFEGPDAIMSAVQNTSPGLWAAVTWQTVGNTMFGFAVWGWLLARHPAAAVAPMSLLVPVFGLTASAFFLAEPLQSWKLIATGLILFGLTLNMVWPLIMAKRAQSVPVAPPAT
jgi:O-acetylserine/cysteine efflux transporter